MSGTERSATAVADGSVRLSAVRGLMATPSAGFSRAALSPPRPQGRMDELVANRGRPTGVSITDLDWMDAADAGAGAGQARQVHREDRYPKAGGATTPGSSRARDLYGQLLRGYAVESASDMAKLAGQWTATSG